MFVGWDVKWCPVSRITTTLKLARTGFPVDEELVSDARET